MSYAKSTTSTKTNFSCGSWFFTVVLCAAQTYERWRKKHLRKMKPLLTWTSIEECLTDFIIIHNPGRPDHWRKWKRSSQRCCETTGRGAMAHGNTSHDYPCSCLVTWKVVFSPLYLCLVSSSGRAAWVSTVCFNLALCVTRRDTQPCLDHCARN